jgi:hypothetical protein
LVASRDLAAAFAESVVTEREVAELRQFDLHTTEAAGGRRDLGQMVDLSIQSLFEDEPVVKLAVEGGGDRPDGDLDEGI